MDNKLIQNYESTEFLFYFNKTIETKCMNICMLNIQDNSKETECLKKCFRSFTNIKNFYIKNMIYK